MHERILDHLLQDCSGHVRLAADRRLRHSIAAVTLDALLEQLKAAPWEDRVDAVNRLAALDDPRVPAALASALHDEDGAVIEAATEAMIATDDLSYVAPLREALVEAEDHQSDVIWDCILRSSGKPVADAVFRASEGGNG